MLDGNRTNGRAKIEKATQRTNKAINMMAGRANITDAKEGGKDRKEDEMQIWWVRDGR
jgi:hypothetical protein